MTQEEAMMHSNLSPVIASERHKDLVAHAERYRRRAGAAPDPEPRGAVPTKGVEPPA